MALQQLQGSFECTDRDVFIDSCHDMSELTDTVSEYINFCKECIIPTKEVKVYANNKPWITSNVKDVINRKKKLFKNDNPDEFEKVKREPKRAIKAVRATNRDKIEDHFKSNNMKRVWDGMRLMSGYNSKSKSRSLPNSSENYANELNTFYNRFDCHDFSAERRDLRKILMILITVCLQ